MPEIPSPFSARLAVLEDARASCLELIERELATKQASAEDRLEALLAAGFAEWERRFREDRGRFLTEEGCHAGVTPERYGAACAPYFIDILREICGAPIHLEKNEDVRALALRY